MWMTCFCFNDSVKYQYVNYDENMRTHAEQRGYKTDVEDMKLCATASQDQLYTHAPASQEKLDKASELQYSSSQRPSNRRISFGAILSKIHGYLTTQ